MLRSSLIAEIERLRVAGGMLRHGIRQLELDLSVKITEAERLHTEIGRRIQDKRESDGRVMAAMEIDERQRAEIERLRASEALAVAENSVLVELAEAEYGYFKHQTMATASRVDCARANAAPILSRAAARRAKKEATT